MMSLWVYIHTGQAESLPDHGGNRTRDLCQQSYKRGQLGSSFDISELSLVPSIPMYFNNYN
jgi:hypothetical protein